MSNRLKPHLRLLSLALLAALPAACANWSGDVARYRQILDGSSPTTPPAYQPADPLPLAQALAMANADNESIASRGEDYVQTLAEKMRQAGNFLPTLSLGPSLSVAGGEGGTSHQFSIPVSASATGSLSNAASAEAAGHSVLQREQLLLNEREAILLQVVEAYYSVLTYERQADVYENGLKLKSEKVRDQNERVRLGNARPLDLAQSQADLSATKVSLNQARTNAANARSALARLMDVPAVTGPLTDAFVLPDDVPPLVQWQADASTTRQDIAAASQALETARCNLDAAIRQYFPSVTVNFNYLLHNDPASMQSWTGALSANLPLFSAFAIEADIRRNWSLYRQAGLIESQTRRQVFDDVQENYGTLEGNRHNIAELKTEVEAAQRAVDLAEQAYAIGSVSNLDRLTQQDSLLAAKLNLVMEQTSEKIHYLSLVRSAGRLATVLQAD